jgi:CheY-like chemotaxis protein
MASVLTVDDEEVIRAMLHVALESDNHEIIEAENGAEAGRWLQRRGFVVVGTDIVMPEKDGLTLCKKIKSHESTSHIPVVMFSSLINEQMATKCWSVKAGGSVFRPQRGQLIELMDDPCLLKEQAAPAQLLRRCCTPIRCPNSGPYPFDDAPLPATGTRSSWLRIHASCLEPGTRIFSFAHPNSEPCPKTTPEGVTEVPPAVQAGIVWRACVGWYESARRLDRLRMRGGKNSAEGMDASIVGN